MESRRARSITITFQRRTWIAKNPQGWLRSCRRRGVGVRHAWTITARSYWPVWKRRAGDWTLRESHPAVRHLRAQHGSGSVNRAVAARAHHFLAGRLQQNLSRHANAQRLPHVAQANAATPGLVAPSPDED